MESSVKETKIKQALGVSKTKTQTKTLDPLTTFTENIENYLLSKLPKLFSKFYAKIAMSREELMFGVKFLTKRLPLDDYFAY